MSAIVRLWLIAVVLLAAPGCAMWKSGSPSPQAPGIAATPPASAVLRADAPPVWRPGDRWIYHWTSGSSQGTKTVEVRDVKDVNGVRYYVVKNAEGDHYWTVDLQWTFSVRDSRVDARMVPPEPWYTWPLEPGRQWRHRGVFEYAGGKTSTEEVFVVVTAEALEVPAGTFRALKITRARGTDDSDEYWYAPDVRSYVRWIGRRGKVEFEEVLSSYQPAGSPVTSPVVPPVPSSTPR